MSNLNCNEKLISHVVRCKTNSNIIDSNFVVLMNENIPRSRVCIKFEKSKQIDEKERNKLKHPSVTQSLCF